MAEYERLTVDISVDEFPLSSKGNEGKIAVVLYVDEGDRRYRLSLTNMDMAGWLADKTGIDVGTAHAVQTEVRKRYPDLQSVGLAGLAHVDTPSQAGLIVERYKEYVADLINLARKVAHRTETIKV